MTARDVGLVGLGLMGSAMATRLLAGGRRVHGYDPAETAATAHRERGGALCANPAEVAARADLVLLSLPDGQVSRAACLGPGGVLEQARAGLVVLDTTTAHPDDVEAIAAAFGETGARYHDVGLSGSSDTVRAGRTLAIAGGVAADLAPRVEDALRAFCHEIVHVGRVGDGMRTKLVVNDVHGLNRFAVAEGLVLAERMGLDLAQTLDVLRASAAYSKAVDNWGPRMVARRYDDPKSHIRTYAKDVRLILDVARRHGAPTLALAQFEHVLKAAMAHGLGGADNSAVVEVLRLLAGSGEAP